MIREEIVIQNEAKIQLESWSGVVLNSIPVCVMEPTYPINLGYIARVMKNFGLSELFIINPKVKLSDAYPFASHGRDLIDSAVILRNLKELTQKFDILVGTTAIIGTKSGNIGRDSIPAEELSTKLRTVKGKACVLLGRDTTGLTAPELELCDLVVTIGAFEGYRTLNISHALAIILYEFSKTKYSRSREIASRSERERIMTYVSELCVLLSIPVHKKKIIVNSLRKIFGRANPTPREINVMNSLFRRSLTIIQKYPKDGNESRKVR
ncbi:MAG: TrmJ/YjtD family RNA methyltransferase [Nitrosopumilus sp.]